MPESSLSHTHSSLRKAIAHFLGYGRDSAKWTSTQEEDIDESLETGQRYFYTPPTLPGEENSHYWTFLRPVTTLTTVAAQSTYTLPDNYGNLLGTITFPENEYYAPIEIIPDDQLRNLKRNDLSTFPQYASIRPILNDGTNGQRFELELFPTPSEAWVLSYRYEILKDKMSSSNPYPDGGQAFAECLREACLAAAELIIDDEYGLHHARFMDLLRSCISRDRRNNTTEFYGQNLDYGNFYGPTNEDNFYKGQLYAKPVTYKGVMY